jgi:hypothetical protein
MTSSGVNTHPSTPLQERTHSPSFDEYEVPCIIMRERQNLLWGDRAGELLVESIRDGRGEVKVAGVANPMPLMPEVQPAAS